MSNRISGAEDQVGSQYTAMQNMLLRFEQDYVKIMKAGDAEAAEAMLRRINRIKKVLGESSNDQE